MPPNSPSGWLALHAAKPLFRIESFDLARNAEGRTPRDRTSRRTGWTIGGSPFSRLWALLLCGALHLNLGLLGAQTLMHGSTPGAPVRLLPSDQAVLELGEARTDLPCKVVPIKPALGFDLRFHAGYEASVPFQELAGSENLLTIILRVIPEGRNDEPADFVQRVRVPLIEAETEGDAYLQGYFDLGEGKYHADWLMRDHSGHVCSFYWDIQAALGPRDAQLHPTLSAGAVQAAGRELFHEEPPVERAEDEPPLNVKVLVNFAPQNSHSATLSPPEAGALVSILRSFAREPRIGRFSVVAFNVQQQRVLYRQDGGDRIDFPNLGRALSTLELGTIDVKKLSQENSETEFLTQLIRSEIGTADHPDALIFAGPKVMLDENVAQEALREVGGVESPVFYMNYNPNPQSSPWRDAIGRVVRFFRGWEYTISRPRDLWIAMNEIVSRARKLKKAQPASSCAPK